MTLPNGFSSAYAGFGDLDISLHTDRRVTPFEERTMTGKKKSPGKSGGKKSSKAASSAKKSSSKSSTTVSRPGGRPSAATGAPVVTEAEPEIIPGGASLDQ